MVDLSQLSALSPNASYEEKIFHRIVWELSTLNVDS